MPNKPHIDYSQLADKISKGVYKSILVVPLTNGIQAHIGKRVILNFYYRAGRVYFPRQGNKSLLFRPGGEVSLINRLYDENNKKDVNTKDAGVVKCINHIQNKLEIFNKTFPGKEYNKTRVILATLTLELRQYL